MKLGLRLPQRLGVDLQHDLVEVARTAEAAGYASSWTYERLLFPQTPVEPYADQSNVPWPEASRQTADPLAVLTAAAVATEKVRPGTAILIAAQHTQVQLAKALAMIDQISDGRVIAGMGTGWSTDELPNSPSWDERQGDPRLCTAHRQRDGKPYGAWAIRGSNVCRIHGGAAKQVRRKADQRLEFAAQRGSWTAMARIAATPPSG
jgi:hypothetical protein